MPIEPEAYPDIEADTKLMNIHHLSNLAQADVYIGPKSAPIVKDLPSKVDVDLQNPFDVARYGRFGAVENYKAYFYMKFLTDEVFRNKIRNLKGKTICDTSYPKYSHGQIIVTFLYKREALEKKPFIHHIQRKLENIDPADLSPEGYEYREEALNKVENALSIIYATI